MVALASNMVFEQKVSPFLYVSPKSDSDGHRYVVEPVALVFHEDNYYIVVYSAKHDSTANYRIDRMDSVEIIDEPVSQKALALRSEFSKCTAAS